MASRLPGGSEEVMRGTATGGALDRGYRSVPVASNTTAPIPNTTVTVTLTCVLGEYAASPSRFHINGVLDRIGVCRDAVSAQVCCGEERVEPKGEALNLPVRSSFLPCLWS